MRGEGEGRILVSDGGGGEGMWQDQGKVYRTPDLVEPQLQQGEETGVHESGPGGNEAQGAAPPSRRREGR